MEPMTPPLSWEEYDTTLKGKGGHTLVDVRTDEEWAAGHAEGAVHVPLQELVAKASELFPDRTALIVLHCNSGGRAGRTCNALQGLGYANVRFIAGDHGDRYRFTA